MFVANIGDAKAVVARSPAADSLQSGSDKSNPLKAIVLTREHKAIYPQERARIQKVCIGCCIRIFGPVCIMYILFFDSWFFMFMIGGLWYWEQGPCFLIALFGGYFLEQKLAYLVGILVILYFPI